MNNSRDLWPPELFSSTDTTLPMTILKNQAALLEQHTAGKVKAEVIVREIRKDEDSNLWDLLLTVNRDELQFRLQALDGYSFDLFKVESNPDLPYPCIIRFGKDELKAADPDEVRSHLWSVFQDSLTRGILVSLRAKSLQWLENQEAVVKLEGSGNLEP